MRPFVKILAVSVVVSTLTMSVNAFSAGDRGGMRPPPAMSQSQGIPHDPTVNLLRGLELSDTQLTALEELTEVFKTEREALGDDRSNKDQALADAITESGLNSSQLTATEQEQCTARSTMRITQLEQVIAILTAEQRLELKSLLEEKASRSTSVLEDLGY